MDIGNLEPILKRDLVCIGIEGSANKVGVGVLRYRNGEYEILDDSGRQKEIARINKLLNEFCN